MFTSVATNPQSDHAVAMLANVAAGPLGSSVTLNAGQTLNITGAGQSLNLTGTLNVSGGGLSVPTITQTAGNFTNSGTLTLAATGGNAATYNLSGGTLTTARLTVGSGGTFNWTTGGTLNLTGSGSTLPTLAVPTGGTLGLVYGNVLAITGGGSATFAGTLNLTGTPAATLPENLITYNSESGTFANVTGIPSGDALSYTGSALELIVSGPTTYNWQPGSGNWSSTGSWIGGVVPNSSTAIVNIDNATTGTDSVATVDQSEMVGTLTLDAGDTLNVNAANTLTVNGPATINGNISNSGIVTMLGGNLVVNSGSTFNVQSGGTLNLAAGSQLQLAGTLNSAGTINLNGSTITGSGSGELYNYSGSINGPGTINAVFENTVGSTLSASTGLSFSYIYNFGTMNLSGTNSFTANIGNYGAFTLSGTSQWSDGVYFQNFGGAATFNSDIGSPTDSAVNVMITVGSITFASTQHLASLSITGGTVTASSASPHSAIFTASLANSGLIDLTNNDLVVQGTSSGIAAANLTNISAQLKSGFNRGPGYWNGVTGIISSKAAGDTRFLTTLGYRQSGGGMFDGTNTSTNDVLVKYTYYGDANLDGTVNGADYQQIDLGYGMHLTGWSNGDFNYDGVVDGSDYSLIDNTFNQITATGASPLMIVASPADTSAVPEPTTVGLLCIGAAALLGRRRSPGLSGALCGYSNNACRTSGDSEA